MNGESDLIVYHVQSFFIQTKGNIMSSEDYLSYIVNENPLSPSRERGQQKARKNEWNHRKTCI